MAATILETLTVRIVADISDLRMQLAQVKGMVESVGRDISDTFAHHISLGDVINAGITAPLALAASQASISSRLIKKELGEIVALQRAAVGTGLLAGPAAAASTGTVGGVVIDGTAAATLRRQAAAAAVDGPDGRQIRDDRIALLTRMRDRASDEHESLRNSGVGGVQASAARVRAAQDALDEEHRRAREIEHDAEQHRQRQRESGGAGRAGFRASEEAMENLGNSARRVGQAARGAAGSGIAQALGLTGLGSLVSSLIPLLADLAAVIGTGLAAALAVLVTPLGLVVAGLTTLVGLLVATNWNEFRDAIEWIGKRFGEVMGERFVSIVAAAKDALDALAYAFKPLTDAFGMGGDEMSAVMKAVAEAVIRSLDAIGAVIEGFIKLFANVVRTIGAIVQGDWKTALLSFHQIFVDVIGSIIDVFDSLFPGIKAAWDKNWPALQEWMGSGFKGFVDGIGEQVQRALGFFRQLMGGREQATGDGRKQGDQSKALVGDVFGLGGVSAVANFGKSPLAKMADESREAFAMAGEEIANSVGRALEDAVMNGRRLNDMMRDLGRTLIAMAFRKLVTEPLMDAVAAAFSGGGKAANSNGGGFGSVLSTIGSTVLSTVLGGGKIGSSAGKIASSSSMNVGDMAATGAGFVYNDNRVIDAKGADAGAVAALQRAFAIDKASRAQEFRALYADARARGVA
jgi:hypothetical protein